ncbi:META domain-containing protein [Aridibaculum aurantiacum]|uniref:META domain-containing protein n=1 Tax=Aridibaculum aurantiacum TaxID=2810307 RepID=UPI001A97BA56|nr:META domain-containing protein [Aridibaculum aurantiacum]
MKKIIFALPLCALFTYCSSSRKATLPPAGPGISNVNVITGSDTVRGAAIAVTPDNRDWAYRATRETTLEGTWRLHGMASEDGQWTTTDQWYKDTTATTTEATFNPDGTEVSVNNEAATQTFHSGSATMQQNKTKTKSTAKNKSSKNALRATSSLQKYDSLMANTVVYTDSALNAGIKPFEYWKRIPTVTLNPTSLVFTGSTGCNSMSGSFNFSGNDIKFNRNITTSKMACNEYNESNFLSMLRKADNYVLNNEGMLELRQGNNVLMVFSKQQM